MTTTARSSPQTRDARPRARRAFRQRILWRTSVVLGFVGALLAIFTVLGLRTYGQSVVRESTEIALKTSTSAVETAVEGFIGEIARISDGMAVLNYAQFIGERGPGATADPLFEGLQSDTLRLFTDYASRHTEYVRSVKYLASDGRLWFEIKQVEGQILVSSELANTIFSFDGTARLAFSEGKAGTAMVSRVILSPGTATPSRVLVYVPVVARTNLTRILGVVQVDATIDPLLNELNTILDHALVEQAGRRMLLLDRSNRILADTDLEGGALPKYLLDNAGAYFGHTIGDTSVSSMPVSNLHGFNTPWRVAFVDDHSLAMGLYNNLSMVMVSLYAVVLAIVLFVLYRILSSLTEPLFSINAIARQLATGQQLDEENVMARGAASNDELGDLTQSLARISHRMSDQADTLRARIQKRSRDLEVAARIGREVAQLYDIDSLLIRAINLICDHFNYYHAQVFLVDDVGANAVLVQSRGEAGKRLLAQNFQIAVGSDSVTGTVTGRGQPVVVNDTTRAHLPHRVNPLLPETRSEIGLPLISGKDIIGVLDIQSREPNAFQEEDIPTFTLLADQLAVAIANARLVSDSDKRIRQIDKLNRQLTRSAWEETGKQGPVGGSYLYNLINVEALDRIPESQPGALSTAISIRNQVIGELSAAPVEGQDFTTGDRAVLQAVASRISLAVENARLFQETQFSLTETSTLYEMSRHLNEANSLPEIIRAIIVSVVPDAIGGQVWLFEDYYEYDAPRWVTVTADLALSERDEHNQDLTGLRLHLPDHQFLSDLLPNQPAFINQAREDARLDSGLKLIFRRLATRAAVIIPISVRGVWRGFITLGFAEARAFSEREGRIYLALIDQAGVAIDNRLLLQQTAEEVARNENLYAASRIINTAQTMADLVYAAVATTNDSSLRFSLGLLEGQLDPSGWPTRARMVATSKSGSVEDVDYQYPFVIAPETPLRNRDPEILVDDTPNIVSSTPNILWMRTQGYRFLATFPLFSANQPMALFHITSEQEQYELTASDYEVYRAVTGQMSSQLQIRRLLERTEQALDEARRLYVASSAITSAQDSEEVYRAAVEHLAGPFSQTERNGQTVEIDLLMAWPKPVAEAPYLEYVFRWNNVSGNVAVQGDDNLVSKEDFPFGALTEEVMEPVYFADLESDASILADRPQFRARLVKAGVTSLVAAPIETRDTWFGAAVCQSNRADAFDAQYRRFLNALADQIAIAVDNRRLFEEARFAADRAQMEAQRALALAEAAQLTSRIGGETVDITRSLNQVFERVAEEGGFDRWMLLLYDEDGRTLVPTTIKAVDAHAESMRLYDTSMPLPIMEAIRQNRLNTVNNPAEYRAEHGGDDPELASLDAFFGKHVAAPVIASGQAFGGMFMGRSLAAQDLHDRDAQLIGTLATQVALALENRRLFQQAQTEQQTLRSILETLPAGVLVLDSQTLVPIQFNQQAQNYLGREIDPGGAFSIESYNLCRTGTTLHYPAEEMPIFTSLQTGQPEFKDDIAIPLETGSVDLMVNAAPITDLGGNVTAIVATFQDITNLRQLENTLQENLRETVALYEAQRQLTESATLDDVLDVMITQLILLQPTDAYILMNHEGGLLSVAREFIQPPENPQLFAEVLKERAIVQIGDIADASLSEDTRTMLESQGFRSLLAIPMNVSIYDAPFGWMVAVSEETDGFTPEHARLLEQLGEAASTAIDNRLLLRRQLETVQEVRSLYNASNAISRSRDEEHLAGVLQNALEYLSPDYYAGVLDSSAGLSVNTLVLFNGTAEELPELDFEALLEGYAIPPTGAFIDDLQALTHPEPAEQRLIAADIRAFTTINLSPREITSGFLVAAYREPRRFSDSEKRYLSMLADGASLVLNNTILFAQIQTALEETSTLYQASRALSDASSTEEILSVVVNYFALPHIDRVFIALLDSPRWDTVSALAHVDAHWYSGDGISMQGATLSRDMFPGWELLSSLEVLTIDNVETAANLTPEQRSGIQSMGMRSLTIIPLRVPARTIGAVWLSSPQAHRHDPREDRTYRAFAEQASLSMEAAYLFQQTQRRARQLETSAEVGRAAGQILDLPVLLPRMVDLIRDAFNYDHVQIFLMDEIDEFAELRASTGEAGKKLLEINHKLAKGSDSVIGQVVEIGEPQIALDTAGADVIHRPNPYLPLTRSEMALPLILQDRVVGAIDVQSNQPNAFSEEDVRVMTTLSAQIAVAIDNANLYESAQIQADKMSFLFQITSSAAAAETLEEALEIVTERMHHMLDALSVVMYLPQMYVDNFGNTFMTIKPMVLRGSDQPLAELEEIRVDDQSKLLSEVYYNMQPFVVEYIPKEDRYLPVVSSAQSAVVLPLTAGGETIGMIVLEDEHPNAYGYDILQLLLTLSGSLSAVVQSLQLLEQLTATNQQLRELDRIKSDFLANMSHELRTPLNSIIGFSRVMLKGIDGELTEMQEQDLSTIYNSGQHLLMLINDILDQAKIAANKMDMKLAYFDIKPLIEGVRSIGIGLVKEKPVKMLAEVAPNLAQGFGDEFRTRQVLINLISNASKFTSEGSITIRVYPIVEEHTGRNMIRVDVVDTGIGIADSDIPLLFEAFRQVDSSLTRTAGGTGLGLPIAKSLIELQGGQMLVESKANAGSIFSITIPTEPAPEEERVRGQTGELKELPDGATLMKPPDNLGEELAKRSQEERAKRPMLAPPPPNMPAKREVLLIEDSKDMVDQFRRILQREGFEVVTADHPAYAEAMVSNMQPTLLVMDVNFADGEGWNILADLKKRDDTCDIPIVVVTLSDESERAFELGAHSFIQRPFVPETILEAVARAEEESNTDRILIIDDQPESVRLITELLNENGSFHIFSATTGEEGISMIARRRPNLVILDLRMPEMDGFAVLQELRSNPEIGNIPVLVVTGEVTFSDDEQKQLDNVHVLHKTDITEERYDQFLNDVRKRLEANGSI